MEHRTEIVWQVAATQSEVLSRPVAFLIAAGLLVFVAAASGVRQVARSERLVVLRSGRPRGVRGPGVRYLLPLVDQGVRVPTGERPHRLWFKATTRDGVPVRAKAIAMVRADDPVRYAATAGDPDGAPSPAAEAVVEVALRDAIADRDLADLPALMADGGDPALLQRVNRAVRPWGVAVTLLAFTDAVIPVGSGIPIGPDSAGQRRPEERRPFAPVWVVGGR